MSVKNGLSAIASEVLDDVQKEAENIVLTGEKNAKDVLKIAKQQADKNYQTLLNQFTTRAAAEKRRIASITEVEMRNYLLQAKEELVDVVFEKALAKLKEFVTTEAYNRYLLKLIKEAAEGLGQKSLEIQVNAKDKEEITQEELKRLSKKLNCEIKILDQTGDFIGGLKAQTADGKITCDSTIENKFNELKPILRVEIAKTIFEEKT